MIVNIKKLNKDKTTYMEERFDIRSIYMDRVGDLSIGVNGQVIPLTIMKKDLIYFPEIDIFVKDAD